MFIVIAGAGLVGGELAAKLVANKHDVVIIDRDKEVCDKLYAALGVIAVKGSVVDLSVLDEAQIAKADALVAATGSDADNLACALLGKSRGVRQVIVRMRNEDYEPAYRLAGVSSVVRVTDLMTNQMIFDIEKPEARRISSISHGKAVISAVNIPQNAKVAGSCIRDIVKNRNFPDNCNFIAITDRETDELHIPRGDQQIHGGDEIYLISPAEDISAAVKFLTAKK